MLEKEFEYFKAHQDELVCDYEGKFVVIKEENVIGAYDSELEAYLKSKEEHEVGTFLIQQAIPGEDSFNQTFNSRVMFS